MRRRLAVVATVPLVFAVAACGTATKQTAASPSASGSVAAANGPAANVKDIKVSGVVGKKPTVTFPVGHPAVTSSALTITEGTGEAAVEGDTLTANVTVYNWDGKTNPSPGSDYDQGHSEFVTVKKGQLPAALYDGLLGAKPGARVLAVVAKDNLTPEQLASAKQSGTDFENTSQVLVIDVMAAAPKAAHGAAADPGIKGVTLVNPGNDTAPKLTTKTSEKPPKDLVVKTVIKGEGAQVKADQTVLAHYTGKIWGSDKQFDSSWDRGAPSSFALSQVVKGWSQGLTGVPIGSRVVISIPPELGYGKEGNAQGGIKGTDTLVFVVDVLAAT
ncbi:FKBP-type peptidyl-prolyl cis-trans isomerase [Streptosporangiaceae bacterium NEAU-GS5]|nr:FKBP-type peptidyl-prolyl cis-trans isomerase [Streptosporangiaceae bacterium NEAU-GS5]